MSTLINNENATGKILEIKGSILTIELVNSNCSTGSKGCDSGCTACSGADNNSKVIKIHSKNAQDFSPGSIISFDYFSVNDIFLLSFVFGVPVCLSIITITAWLLNSPAKIESPAAIFSIVFSFISGFVFIWLAELAFRNKFPATIHTKSEKKRQDQ